MNTNILDIANLHVAVGDKEIIKGIDLSIKKGEVHVLFGPNGSGKSTLLCAIMQLPGYTITEGSVHIHDTDTAELTTDAIANLGVGMSFQYPPKIKGVTLRRFLDSISQSRDLHSSIAALNMEPFLERELNVGFSGGELKRAEILKLYAQSPDLLLIDEPESGVDIENITVISNAINTILQKESPMASRERSALIITHTGNILSTVHADVGHVFMDGKIICTGNPLDIMEDIKKGGFSGCIQCIANHKEKQ
ncbi:MAG: ABC transporter ATP-binding protein [Sulfuricurvum sp. MLSB]|uniref:ABC transporter ATP-binding protein n=1 Tax=unclassified Sulfuricurvum TaxID=2632390 RepID=UPI0005077324|nr:MULTISPECIES: ABC transporter ATP-binding protein [unclassified Sulfuricurvum]KFN39752.1 MAG: ABC transporter ATP-binding protein [Sulfuricurvum sp. MLSB]